MTSWQDDYDREDYRQSLYTNTKEDHPALWWSGEPCGCETGDDQWEEAGKAMAVRWPRLPDSERESRLPDSEREREAG